MHRRQWYLRGKGILTKPVACARLLFILLASTEELNLMLESREAVLLSRANGSQAARPAELGCVPREVLHARKADGCGHRECLAKYHLRLGTNVENVADRVADAGENHDEVF